MKGVVQRVVHLTLELDGALVEGFLTEVKSLDHRSKVTSDPVFEWVWQLRVLEVGRNEREVEGQRLGTEV